MNNDVFKALKALPATGKQAKLAAVVRDVFEDAKQAIGQASISQSEIGAVRLRIPPIPEQKRIVAKVDHLMSLLDGLEAKLRKQEETATRLAESLAAAVAA